jgi:hypothetical protein
MERDHSEGLSINGIILLKCIFKKWDVSHGLNWYGSRQENVAG